MCRPEGKPLVQAITLCIATTLLAVEPHDDGIAFAPEAILFAVTGACGYSFGVKTGWRNRPVMPPDVNPANAFTAAVTLGFG
jgi:hypothetical protein